MFDWFWFERILVAPAPGFEPGTKWLTVIYSTAELCRNLKRFYFNFINGSGTRIRTWDQMINSHLLYRWAMPESINLNIKKEVMAPAPGFEPGTKWLTVIYSTAELCRILTSSLMGWNYSKNLLYCQVHFIRI